MSALVTKYRLRPSRSGPNNVINGLYRVNQLLDDLVLGGSKVKSTFSQLPEFLLDFVIKLPFR